MSKTPRRPPRPSPIPSASDRARDARKPGYRLVVDAVRIHGPCKAAALRAALTGWTSGQISRGLAQAVREGKVLRKGKGANAIYSLANLDAVPPAGKVDEPPAAALQQAWRGAKPPKRYRSDTDPQPDNPDAGDEQDER